MKTAVCLVVKNEEDSLAEWMAYHLAIGFDSAIIFDNASTDRSAEVIDAFAGHHDVRRINWANTTPAYQIEAYNFAVAHMAREFDWIAFIDCDEFLVPLRDPDIATFLARFPDASAIAVNWALFGSAGHLTRPPGLVIENFLRRSEVPFSEVTQHVKSIVRPRRAIAAANPHYVEVDGPFVTPHGEPVVWSQPGITRDPPVYDVLQLNHYFVKSAEQWAKKIRRGYHDTERSGAEFDAYDRNEIEDTAILRFLPATRRVLDGVR